MMLHHVVADRVHQVRLAEADAAVDKKRVVRTRRRFRYSAAGRMCELIGWPDDEGVERVTRDEAAGTLRHGAHAIVIGVGHFAYPGLTRIGASNLRRKGRGG